MQIKVPNVCTYNLSVDEWGRDADAKHGLGTAYTNQMQRDFIDKQTQSNECCIYT